MWRVECNFLFSKIYFWKKKFNSKKLIGIVKETTIALHKRLNRANLRAKIAFVEFFLNFQINRGHVGAQTRASGGRSCAFNLLCVSSDSFVVMNVFFSPLANALVAVCRPVGASDCLNTLNF